MIETKKEKAIVRFYDGNTLIGGLNFATGEWIGKTNRVVKNVPRGLLTDFTTYEISQEAVKWTTAINWYASHYTLSNAVELLGYVERAMMVNLVIEPEGFTKEELQSLSFNASFVEGWRKSNGNAVLTANGYRRFLFQKEKEKKASYRHYSLYFCDFLDTYMSWAWSHFTLWDDLFFLIQHNRLFLCSIPSTFSTLSRWVKHCEYMGEPVRTKKPIFIALDDIMKRYEANKDKLLDDRIRKSNDKPYLYFEDDTLVARPLLSVAEIHAEAEQQKNCLERLYLDKIAEGYTNVVAVRRKKDPNTAYITCEVRNGAIVQWKTYCNGIPLTSNDFRKAYQAHIQQACFDGKEKN